VRGPWPVLAVSATVGFAVGALVRPTWTDNVESAQVLAGVVQYPSPTPMYHYHTSAYSLTIQAAAVLLRLGVPEWPLSLVSSGLQGALSFGALSLFALAVSRSAALALVMPVLVLRLRECCEGELSYIKLLHGHMYPNVYPNDGGIYGVVGLFSVMAVLALLGLRRIKAAAFLLGLLPGLHLGLALPCFLGVGVAGWYLGHERRRFWREGRLAAAIGLAISVAGAAVQVAFFWTASDAAPAARVREVMENFLRSWEDHNFLLPEGARLAFFESEIYTFILGVAMLTVWPLLTSRPARAMVAGLLAITAAAAAYTVLLNWRADLVPLPVRNLLIMRWLNLSTLAFAVIGLGLLTRLAFRRRNTVAALALAAVLALFLSGVTRSLTAASGPGVGEDETVDWHGLAFPLTLVLGTLLAGGLESARWAPRHPHGVSAALAALSLVVAGAYLVSRHFSLIDGGRLRGLDDDTDVLDAARGRPGFLLPCEGLWAIGRVQTRTRRPLLLDPTQLNMLTKVPGSAPRMAEILERVYGIDIVHGAPGDTAGVWSGRSPEEWQAIAGDLGVTDVLVWSGLELPLPEIHRGPQLSLYTIPSPRQDTREVIP
jgi:hypothetical protein